MINNKKRVAVTAAAVVLGALLVLGGATMAWLQGSTSVTTNEFATNSNSVRLRESKTSFDIVPGTSEEKDPTITATYTLDSYVFVEITDNTKFTNSDGEEISMVDWALADGWTLLPSYTSTASNEEESTTYTPVTTFYL